MIEKNNIDAIIGLPANIFFGTSIPTLIMVLKKNRGNEGVLIIDASKGFVKDGKQNKLRACDVKKIADTYRERKEISGYSRVVTRDEIRRNEYNLNIPRYVDSNEPPTKYDIYSTMFGGIPDNEIADFGKYWGAFPTLQQQIFAPEHDRPYSTIKVADIINTIHNNADVIDYKNRFTAAFADLSRLLHVRLVDNVDTVKDVVENDLISANIFQRTVDLPLVDKYAAYQILADNWAAIMGDVEIIQTEGIGACNVVEPKTKMVKDKNGVEQEVIDGLKGRIIPFELVQKTLFTDELKAIVALQNRLDAIDGELEAARDKLLSMEDAEPYMDSENENALIKNKIKADSKPKAVVEDEIKEQLKAIVALWDEQTALKKKIKSDKETLEKKTITAIQGFNMKDINRFLDLKWIEPITSAIAALPNTIIQSLADAVTSLNEKYAVTYRDIENSIVDSEQELAKLIDQLTGDEYAIAGLSNLFKK